MPVRKEGISRKTFIEKVERSKTEMTNKETEMDMYAGDVETARGTLESLELFGAQEDISDVKGAIEQAEQITEGRFDQENEQLERLQGENKEIEKDFDERQGKTESDVSKLGEAKLESLEAKDGIAKAREAALRGKEFLDQQLEVTRKAGEQSEDAEQKLRARVQAVRGR